jgi:hypothetical protein
MRHLLRGAVLLVSVFVACDSPFEPQGNGERVPVNRELSDAISRDSIARYSFTADAGAYFVVFLEALEGNVQMSIVDSNHFQQVATINAGPGYPTLRENPSPVFSTQNTVVYNLRASTFSEQARFRFLIYPIRTSPEHSLARFEIGDTVSGETIDPAVDLDEFFVRAIAGQEIVGVVEAQGTPGSGTVALTVMDPVTPQFLGYAFGDVSPQVATTTGRIRLPKTQDYEFFSATSIPAIEARTASGPT